MLSDEVLLENFRPLLKSYYSLVNKKVQNPNLITYELDQLLETFSNDDKGMFLGKSIFKQKAPR